MKDRVLFLIAALTLTGMGLAPGQTAPASKTPVKTWTVPRTADGHPNLQGVWNTASLTPFQRPPELGVKQSFTEEEAQAYEDGRLRDLNRDRRDGGNDADLGRAYNEAWFDRGTKIARTRQTSLVVDPPDGRVPPLTQQGKAKYDANRAYYAAHPADGPEDRPLPDRCIQFSQVGPPMLPGNYNDNYQIVQTPDSIAILAEMGYVVRLIPIAATTARPHLAPNVRQWTGDARGRWEGDTLVVESTNFNTRGRARFGVVYDGPSDENLKVTERFTRTGPDTILYRATVEDATLYTKPWTLEIPMNKAEGPVYEYACHEGNYGMHGILSGERKQEQKAAGR